MSRPISTFLSKIAARLRRGGARAVAKSVDGPAAGVSVVADATTLARKIDEEKAFLLGLIQGIETEFLATGGGLDRAARQLGEIQKECGKLTSLTTGEAPDACVQFAFHLLKKAEDLVRASYEQYDHVFATFRELQRRLSELATQRDELMRALLPLTFIIMSIRIEASRHPSEVRQSFFTLAETVNRTVSEVRETMDRQFRDLTASEEVARGLMEQVAASIERHRAAVGSALQRSRSQLRVLGEALRESGAGAANLARLHLTVGRHIGSIVMAQQCQDIARQRIEHVGEALDEMRAHLAERPAGADAKANGARQFIWRAAQIQLHQVQDVFGKLKEAAEGLTHGMHSLRAETAAAAEIAVKIGETALDTSAADQCQAGVGEILSIVAQAVGKTADIIAVFEPLQASFVDCTGQATALASDVRYAGLNAQIFAVHAPDGAALEVLAGRVLTISDEVIGHVGELGCSLRQTTEMIKGLRHRLEDFKILAEAEEHILVRESGVSKTKLSELKHDIPEMIRTVTERQATFSQSVEEVLGAVKFPLLIARAEIRSVDFFRGLVAWGVGGARSSGDSNASEKLDQLRARYTMESERRLHAAVLEVDVVDRRASSSAKPAGVFSAAEDAAKRVGMKNKPGDDLGDNVDLF